MSRTLMSGVVLLVGLLLVACTSESISLREDIFLSKPVWEEARLGALLKEDATTFFPNQRGLARLVKQVLNETVDIASVKEEQRILLTEITRREKEPATLSKSDESAIEQQLQEYDFIADEESPIPSDIAKNPVTEAIVRIMLDTCKQVGCANPTNSEHRKLSLSTSDFENLAKLLVKNVWIPNQRELAQNDSKNGSFDDPEKFKDPKAKFNNLKWRELFVLYMLEYYNGKYVDRYGVPYSKPKVDFSITNETIVAFVNIFQESLWDYSFIGLAGKVKDPVVYKSDNLNEFLNSSKAVPTLAKVLRGLRKDDSISIPGVLESERNDPRLSGLTKNEVCVIHYFSGLSGDASEALAGAIVRAFGGANLGFVIAYQKFSIGDHQTLVKLIDATVETFSKRSADLVFSTILYSNTAQRNSYKNAQKEDWEWIKKHVEIANFLKCFEST